MEPNEIQVLNISDFEKVRDFYWSLIDKMQESTYRPGWEKCVYPSDDFLVESLNRAELYTLTNQGRIVGAMILNHSCNDGYIGTEWGVDAATDEVIIIHALGVLPDYQGKGIAKKLVQAAIHVGKKSNQKAIRLDVLNGNLPASRLYESCGFQFCRKVSMFYEDTGWTDYLLYELVL